MPRDLLPDQGDSRPPIVDPEGEWLLVPVAVAADQQAAVAFARDYWPDKPCYEPWPQERMTICDYDQADEDGRATLDEYGGSGVAMPCADDEGEAYWPVQCSRALDETEVRTDG